MAGIHHVFLGEIFKLRRTAVSWLILLFPVLVSALYFFVYLDKGSELDTAPDGSFSQWTFYAQNFLIFFVMFYPMLAALTAFSLVNVEYKNSGWKLLYTQPVRKSGFYFSKVLLLYSLLLICAGLGFLLLVASGIALSHTYPNLGFSDTEQMIPLIGSLFFKVFVVGIAIASVHLFLALCYNNFVLCVGSACFLVIFGMIASRWKHAYLFPYTNSFSVLDDLGAKTVSWIPQYIWINALYAFGFLIAGYFIVKYKQTK